MTSGRTDWLRRLGGAATWLMVGWLVWLVVSATVASILEALLSAGGSPGWTTFLVVLLGGPLGAGAGLSYGTWRMRRARRGTGAHTPSALVPFLAVTLGCVAVFWLDERSLAGEGAWWGYLGVILLGVMLSVALSGGRSALHQERLDAGDVAGRDGQRRTEV